MNHIDDILSMNSFTRLFSSSLRRKDVVRATSFAMTRYFLSKAFSFAVLLSSVALFYLLVGIVWVYIALFSSNLGCSKLCVDSIHPTIENSTKTSLHTAVRENCKFDLLTTLPFPSISDILICTLAVEQFMKR